MKLIFFKLIFLILIHGCWALETDISVLDGVSDRTSSDYSLDGSAGTLELRQTSHRWIWPVQVSRPGTYTISVQVGVASDHEGATLRIGEWLPTFGEGSTAVGSLQATHPASDVDPTWQSLGSIHLTSIGRHNLFARFSNIPGPSAGLLHAIRLVGPGEVQSTSSWEARTSACDPGTTGAGSLLRARYTEVIPRPAPLPSIGGTFTTCQAPGGYLGCQESFFWSSWESGGVFPDILHARGGTREYDHEGSGRTISLEALSMPLDIRRKSLVLSKPDGNGDLLSTVLVGEANQAWHLLGRMRRPSAGTTVSSTLGFLENPGNFNAHLMRRNSGWANPWFFGEKANGGPRTWSQPDQLKAHLRGPSPTASPPLDRGTYPWGSTRLRQDLMEMTIGGQLPIAANDTFYSTPNADLPELPTLNLAYDLKDPEYQHLAPDAGIGASYSANLADLIHDPFSDLDFEFSPLTLPGWLALASNGALSGTPSSSDAGKNQLTFSATDPEAGLSGSFTAVIHVTSAGNSPPIFLEPSFTGQIAATLDATAIFSPRTYDPDSGDTLSLSILSGNDGTFAIDTPSGTLVKTATPAPNTTWNLVLQISDDGTPQGSDTLAVTLRSEDTSSTGGAFRENWFTLAGSSVSDLTSAPSYPQDPDQQSLVGDLEDPAIGKNTGSRIRGWILPPTTGDYTFWISGDDSAEFWLSDDDIPTSMLKRCEASNSSRFRDYDKGGAQQSASIALNEGSRYYFEVFTKRAGGVGGTSGSFSVAWDGPGLERRPIEAEHLVPWNHLAPAFFKDDITLLPGLTGAEYSELLHTKISTLPLHSAITYSKISGPAWLTVSDDGTLSGSPGLSDAGSNAFVLRATTPGGLTDEANFLLEVEVNEAPAWKNSLTIPSVDEGSPLETEVHSDAVDLNLGSRFGEGDSLTFSLSGAPTWLFITTEGTLHGTPPASEIGDHPFDLVATDSGGLSSTRTVTITVNDINVAPDFINDSLSFQTAPLLPLSHDLNLQVYDADPGDPLTFISSNLPDWVSLTPNGLLSGNAQGSHIGRHTFDLTVTDPTSLTDTITVHIDVSNPDPVLYEGFEGTAGDQINGFGSGTGWKAPTWSRFSGTSGASTLGIGNSFPGLDSLGRSSALSGGEDLERTLNQRYTIGDQPGHSEELWITFSLESSGSIASGHAYELALVDENTEQLSFGKPINDRWSLISPADSVDFTSNNGSSNLGNWQAALRLSFDGTDTEVTAWLAKEGDAELDPTDVATYPRVGAVTLPGSISFDRIHLLSHNTNSARIDEISIGNSLTRALSQAEDTDLDGTPNHLDSDDDDDLIPDVREALYGTNPLVADAELAPQGSSSTERIDFGIVPVGSPSRSLAMEILNNGSGVPLTLNTVTIEGSQAYSLASVPASIPAGSSDLVVVTLTPGSNIGRESAVLVVNTNGLINTPLQIPVEALIIPEGSPLCMFDFDPDEADGAQLDQNSQATPNWTVSTLMDEATGSGALSNGNQTETNRNINSSGATGNLLAFSANRESDGETPDAPGGNSESTWNRFRISADPDFEVNLTNGTALIETYASSSLGSTVSTEWTLYFSTDGGAQWASLGTQSGASTLENNSGPMLLSWDLSPIHLPTSSIEFILDPVSTGAINGTVGQRWTGFDNFTVIGEVAEVEIDDFNSWALEAGIDPVETGDTDRDRIPELLEYALGLNPNQSEPCPGTWDGITLSFAKGSTAVTNGDLRYAIEVSSDLAEWSEVVVQTGAEESIEYSANPGSGTAFARLKVERLRDARPNDLNT